MSTATVNRRAQDRFTLTPMYTTVCVERVRNLRLQQLTGHAYDISATGVRIELDRALEIGEHVSVQIGLPGEDVDIFASAQVVWCSDPDDDPGARRMALQFAGFLSDDDRRRLVRYLGSGLCRRAA